MHKSKMNGRDSSSTFTDGLGECSDVVLGIRFLARNVVVCDSIRYFFLSLVAVLTIEQA